MSSIVYLHNVAARMTHNTVKILKTMLTNLLIYVFQKRQSKTKDFNFLVVLINFLIVVYFSRLCKNEYAQTKGIRCSLHFYIFVCHCQVRDIGHTNLNPYIGVCVTSPNVCIISHYCYRGSIEVRPSLSKHQQLTRF